MQKGDIKSFRFVDSPEELHLPSDARIGRIPSTPSTKLELLDAIASVLDFPGYFGRNWNALWDCLGDFSWIDSRVVVMVHENLPRALPESELRAYLEILADAVVDWKAGEAHQLVVSFPAGCRSKVEAILRKPAGPADPLRQ